MLKILILGGTTEATGLAASLAGDARFDVLFSYAGATRAPRPAPVPWRVGGFGGADGLAAFLRDGGFHVLVDATHPFARQIKRNALQAASDAGVALIAVHRPGWTAQPDDRWTMVADMVDAARALGVAPRRVLLTVGQKELAPFRAAPQHDYIIRSVDPPPAEVLPPRVRLIPARGPFQLAEEEALLRALDVSVLVTKNSGGDATDAKLTVCRRLDIEVVMVERPAHPAADRTCATAARALEALVAHAEALRLV